MIKKLNELVEIAKNKTRQRISVAAAGDEDVLKAIKNAREMGIVEPVLVGDKEKIKEALQLVNAEELSERYFGELSDGEKQKLIIARAIAQEPKLIILDEPTIHLDPKNKIEVLSILYRLSKKKE